MAYILKLKKLLLLFFFILIFSNISFAANSLGYNNPILPKLIASEITIASSSYSNITNINNTYYNITQIYNDSWINESIDLMINNDTIIRANNLSWCPINYSFNQSLTDSLYVPYTGANQNVNLGNNNLTVNGSTLFVDSNNGRVGIGTAAPAYLLHVNGQSQFNGQMRIGDVNDGLSYTYTTGSATILGIDTAASGYNDIDIRCKAGVGSMLYLDTSGNIGIGTTTPAYALDVNGDIRAQGGGTLILTSSTARGATLRYAGGLANLLQFGPTTSNAFRAVFGMGAIDTAYGSAVNTWPDGDVEILGNNSVINVDFKNNGNVNILRGNLNVTENITMTRICFNTNCNVSMYYDYGLGALIEVI